MIAATCLIWDVTERRVVRRTTGSGRALPPGVHVVTPGVNQGRLLASRYRLRSGLADSRAID